MKKISADKLKLYIADLFKLVGLNPLDSKRVSESLVFANLRGVDSHGVLRAPIYIKRIQNELVKINGTTKIKDLDSSFAIADGDNQLGQIVACKGTNYLKDKAQKNVLSGILIKNSNHFGQAAEYTIELATNGLIGIVISNSVALMPAIGGAEKVIGNNPVSISFCSINHGVITLDMALSQVAQGKVRIALERGNDVPLGWGTNSSGENTTNPEDILNDGFLLPAAGPKGFGLALAVEVMTSLISGMPVGKQVASLYQLKEKAGVSHLMIAINPNKIIDSLSYQSQVDYLLNSIVESKRAPGVNKIYLPGQIEKEIYKRRIEEGVPVDDKVMDQLMSIGLELGLNTPDFF